MKVSVLGLFWWLLSYHANFTNSTPWPIRTEPFSFCCFSDITEFKQTCWVSIWCRQWTDSVQYQRLVARFILSNLSLNLFIPMQTNYFGGRGYIGITLSDRLSACVFFPMTCKCNCCYTDSPILMKLFTVAINILRMCMKEEDPSLKYQWRSLVVRDKTIIFLRDTVLSYFITCFKTDNPFVTRLLY